MSKFELKDSGTRREFDTGAVRDMAEGKGRYDLLPWHAIKLLAIHCENGSKKYGLHNNRQGVPLSSYLDSAARHLAKHIQGYEDEGEDTHAVAAIWNLAFYLETKYAIKTGLLPVELDTHKKFIGPNDPDNQPVVKKE